MAHTYDVKCYELAEHFLREEPSLNAEAYRRALASAIQGTIEQFIQDALDEAALTKKADDLTGQVILPEED